MNTNTQHTNLGITELIVQPSIKSVLKIPKVLCFKEIERDGNWLLIERPKSLADVMEVPELAHSPKFWEVDIRNQEAVIAFSASMGHHLVPVGRVRWRDVFDAPKGSHQINTDKLYVQEVKKWSRDLGWGQVTEKYLFDTTRELPFGRSRVHLSEISGRIWMMQSLLDNLIGVDLPRSQYRGIAEFPENATPTTPSLTVARFNRFLTPFSPSVKLTATEGFLPPVTWESPGALPATALEIAALMIYNGSVQELKWHSCARCGEPFQFQVGRTERANSHRPARIDAKFCTDRCASRYTQKAYRERQKSKKKGSLSNVEARK
jgi:hypothetical protein